MSKPKDARAALEQVFDAIPDLDQKWKTLIEEAFTAEKIRDVSVGITCKCCEKYRKYVIAVPIPDWSARVKALDLLLTQAKGKPAETKVVDLKVFAAQTRDELERMSDEDLALVAAGTPNTKELTMGTKASHQIRGNALHPVKQPAPKMPKVSTPDGTPSSENVPQPGYRRKSR